MGKSGVHGLTQAIRGHIETTLAVDPDLADRTSVWLGLAFSVRDRLVRRWLDSQRACYELLAKRVYYLSMEFLPGRFLRNYLAALDMEDEAREALRSLGQELEEIEEEEWDPGLGNGGLGRLASCFLDSLATLKIPGIGYGIRYDFGIFHQRIVDGYQVEEADNWRRSASPWEIERPEVLYRVQFNGRSEAYRDSEGELRFRWVDTGSVLATASDILIPGFGGRHVGSMRLWTAHSTREFDLAQFNVGDYIGAVESKVLSEKISKVLYPSDEIEQGRELRLMQQHFFVSATLQDILRRFRKQHRDWSALPDFVAIQLNDTHPAMAVPELMRLLMDEEGLGWNEAWAICQGTFAYTNHTVLPEALETWPVDLVGRILPRHLQIIYEINFRFLSTLKPETASDPGLAERISLVQEVPDRRIRMAHLAIVGGHSVNGVAALHSRILRDELFRDFDRLFPGRFRNVTNGVTPRRFLAQANPGLARLITSVLGDGWMLDLEGLRGLVRFAEDQEFRARWREVRLRNKKQLARYILRKTGLGVNPESIFDVHVKRIHEYKRQLLNVLHVITLYRRIKEGRDEGAPSRTVIFGGKAAPAYQRAKLIIKLINSVAETVNSDRDVRGRLRVVFMPNYCVSQAEKLIAGADLSEQISTAGMEASGTGNMKFALNGALTIGTLDGANIEIMEAVGRENIFIFGLTAEEVADRRRGGYSPRELYDRNPELRASIEAIAQGAFSGRDQGRFAPIVESLLNWGDYYLVLADFQSYLDAQRSVEKLFGEPEEWSRRSILNTASMGRFSSDRAVSEYAREIWGAVPLDIEF